MADDKKITPIYRRRCALCGHDNPMDASVCENKSCRAQLGLYGRLVDLTEEEDYLQWKQKKQQETIQTDQGTTSSADRPWNFGDNQSSSGQTSTSVNGQSTISGGTSSDEKNTGQTGTSSGGLLQGGTGIVVKAAAAILGVLLASAVIGGLISRSQPSGSDDQTEETVSPGDDENDDNSGGDDGAGNDDGSGDDDSGNGDAGNDDGTGNDDGSGDDGNDTGNQTGTMTLVAEPLASTAIMLDGAGAMDLLFYATDELSFDTKSDGEYTGRSFDGTASDYDVLFSYIELLCSEYNFELADDPYYEVKKSVTVFDFVLTYTGMEQMTGSGINGLFSGVSGDIMIYGTIERDTLEGFFYYDPALEMIDEGWRYGSSTGGNELVGTSAGAGLYRLADGSFQTTDGRLSAAVGEAMLITDGVEETQLARYVWDNDADCQEIFVENSLGTTLVKIRFPNTTTLASGQIYTEYRFMVDNSGDAVTRLGVYDKVPPLNWKNMFVCVHGDDYVAPIRGMIGEMTRLNIRVLYVEEDSVAVFYFCTRFKSSPNEVEGLIAVSIGEDSVVENQPDGEYTIYVGESIEITGPWESGAGHSLWTWEYLEGSQFSELTGTTSQTCTLTGNKAGDVRVKVTYDYSVSEPDVLTGISKTVQKVQEQEFVVHIVNK
ncbi:MAG: hypothetical protein LUH19_06050 [Lachnospiraceae bacterium]|nr:hypothetical protein [Lachnospiraceae bacterium]